MPLIHAALHMMRGPSRVFGVAALHEFLERGFDAFHRMNGANEFLATIAERETALMDAIMAGAKTAFADPLAGVGSESPEPRAGGLERAAPPNAATALDGEKREESRAQSAPPQRKPRPPRA
jgi:hypothetical protein